MNKLILLITLLTASCATVPEVRVVRPVEPPVIEAPVRPNIPAGSEPREVLRAAAIYINELEATLRQALAALNIYRKEQ